MNVLVINCGSSSLKFQLIDTSRAAIKTNDDIRLASGTIERIGSHSLITFTNELTTQTIRDARSLREHRSAIDHVLHWLTGDAGIDTIRSGADVHAVGHRVVHGGEHFAQSQIIDERVIKGISDLI